MSDRSNTPDGAFYKGSPCPESPNPSARDDFPPDAALKDDTPQRPQQVEILVVDMHQNEIHFKIKATTRLGKVTNAFIERQNAAPSSLRFFFEGKRIVDDDTPESVS